MSFAQELMTQLDRIARIRPPAEVPVIEQPYESVPGTKARLKYILSPKTGASVATVAALARVPASTVRRWAAGATPRAEYRGQIDDVYQRFVGIDRRTKVQIPRQRAARRVLAALERNTLKLTNDAGQQRYWKPGGFWWPRFVDRWAANDEAGLDEDWTLIVEDWDYPDPWRPPRIDDIQIV